MHIAVFSPHHSSTKFSEWHICSTVTILYRRYTLLLLTAHIIHIHFVTVHRAQQLIERKRIVRPKWHQKQHSEIKEAAAAI